MMFSICSPILALIYWCAFQRQMYRGRRPKIADANSKIVQKDATMYTPENCAKYATCVLSTINSCIVGTAGPIAIVYHRYWEDPLYGTPGIAMAASVVFVSYLLVDLVAGFVVHFTYRLDALHWDVIAHHILFTLELASIGYPDLIYQWWPICHMYTMEISTIFLNGQFLAKWYRMSESVIFKFKMGFLISWFTVRVPVAFVVMPGYLYLYWDIVRTELPMRYLVGYIVGATMSAALQSMWTVALIKKVFVTFYGAKVSEEPGKNFDLMPASEEENGKKK